jgi:ParB family transcriptional regulator, chromosome partitioning protein
VFVVLNHDGTARVERGFIRREDETQEPQAEESAGEVEGYVETDEGTETGNDDEPNSTEEAEDHRDGKTLSDLLVRDLTAHRTLGLRLALGEQPDVALIAVTHALAAQTFYRGVDASCLEIRLASMPLGGHADGIEDTAAARLLSDRHTALAAAMPRDVAEL